MKDYIGKDDYKYMFPEKEKDEQIQSLVWGIRDRAQHMWIEGNPPTPRWWLERIQEMLKHILKPKENE